MSPWMCWRSRLSPSCRTDISIKGCGTQQPWSSEECCPGCLAEGWGWRLIRGRGRAALPGRRREAAPWRSLRWLVWPRSPWARRWLVSMSLWPGPLLASSGVPPQLPVGVDHREARPEGGVGLGVGTGTGTRRDRSAESERNRLSGAVRAFLRRSRVEGQGELSPVPRSALSCAPALTSCMLGNWGKSPGSFRFPSRD